MGFAKPAMPRAQATIVVVGGSWNPCCCWFLDFFLFSLSLSLWFLVLLLLVLRFVGCWFLDILLPPYWTGSNASSPKRFGYVWLVAHDLATVLFYSLGTCFPRNYKFSSLLDCLFEVLLISFHVSILFLQCGLKLHWWLLPSNFSPHWAPWVMASRTWRWTKPAQKPWETISGWC